MAMLMVMAGVRICSVQSLLFITAMMLMILVMVMASMLTGRMQTDWFFAVATHTLMATVLNGRM